MNYINDDENNFSGDIFKWDIYTILSYIKVHYVQFLLLILVFIIIYIVDYITNLNAAIFTFPSPIPGVSSTASKPMNLIKNKSKSKSKK